jgi:hypothetical protein
MLSIIVKLSVKVSKTQELTFGFGQKFNNNSQNQRRDSIDNNTQLTKIAKTDNNTQLTTIAKTNDNGENR